MSSSVSILESELERARERLKGTEDSIKKNIGRGIISPPNRGGFKRRISDIGQAADVGPKEPQRPRLSFEGFGRGQGRLGPPVNSKFGARNQAKPEERISAKKRLGEQGAVTVFSRLSGPPKDDEYERTEPVRQEVKLTSQVVTTQDAPSRKEVLAAQSGDNQCRARNRRMFGALLGTLQKFRQEENQLKEKEQKRAQVEKKLEEAALKEKEELKKKRQELFSNRRQQQFEIKKLEFKLLRLKQLSEWEATRKHLLNFIQTKSSPKIFWLPKIHTDKTKKLQDETKASITKMIQEKRAEVEKSIDDHNDQKRDANETMDDSLDKTDDFDKSMEMNPTDENANADVLEKSADIPSPAVQEVDEPRIDDDQSQDGDAADAEAMETSMAESEAAEVEEESLNGRLSDIEPPPPQS
ncbi:pinin [Nesidiocoris tenuis]|uniref:Pinin n=1 Tax=Nesidiocoris tenuis TaxID=355587 RepID=A0ABN7B868_9HEMI|nr:pinin [Nesidiocoris tenuis]